jgi:hypothetical protein
VSGFIFANSRLSGIPDLCLTFVDADVLDDCAFHPCVRYNRYDKDRTVSFVPPDGQFEVHNHTHPQASQQTLWRLISMLCGCLWMCVVSVDALSSDAAWAHPAPHLLCTTGNTHT